MKTFFSVFAGIACEFAFKKDLSGCFLVNFKKFATAFCVKFHYFGIKFEVFTIIRTEWEEGCGTAGLHNRLVYIIGPKKLL